MAIAKPNIFYAWAETGSVTDPGTAKTQAGWTSEIPTFQNFNWILNRQDVFNKHVNERGISEWDSSTPYIIGSLVTGSDGSVYKSLTDPNTANNPVGDGGVLHANTNWILNSVDNRWFDYGNVPTYYSSTSVELVGVDLTARYPRGTRVKISGPATGIIYADVNTAFFLSGNTRLALTIDNNASVVNEALDYLVVSTFDKNDSNLPYGLSGLNDALSSTQLQNVIRRVRIAGSVSSGNSQLVMTFPDVRIADNLTTGSGSTTLLNDPGFMTIGTFSTANSIRITNISGKTLNIRSSLNKAAWVNDSVADTVTLDKALGADGIIEIQVSNKDTADPRALNSVIETDASNSAFAQNILTKNHFV